MTGEHSHTHKIETECAGDDCDQKHHEQYTHTHDGGHTYHVHRPEGARLVKLEEVVEPEPESEPSHSRSPLWDGE